MRIQKVTISNFGPVIGTVIFVNKAPIGVPLLIYGDNGVGKSTIFDAITLALFKSISRKGRVNDGYTERGLIHSSLQSEGDKMMISIEIEYGGEEYIFSCEQTLIVKRANKNTETVAQV